MHTNFYLLADIRINTFNFSQNTIFEINPKKSNIRICSAAVLLYFAVNKVHF